MKDFVGKELNIGDKVVYCRTIDKQMDRVITKVIGFTDISVKVEPYTPTGVKRGFNAVNPWNCIKI